MADFNSQTPTLRGLEWRPALESTLTVAGGQGVILRVRPGAVTISALHNYLAAVVGTPGLGLEVLNTLIPTTSTALSLAGSNTGRTVTGWQDQASVSPVPFTDLSDLVSGTYAVNTSRVINGTPLPILFRGSGTPFTATRIVNVGIFANISSFWSSSLFNLPSTSHEIRGILQISATNYYSDTLLRTMAAGQDGTRQGGFWLSSTWDRNPTTGLPWTSAQVDLLTNALNDSFGVDVQPSAGNIIPSVAEGGIQVAELGLSVTNCAENRLGFLYSASSPTTRWFKSTLGSTAAAAANSWVYLHLFPLNGSATDYVTIPILTAPDVLMASSPSASIGEQRKSSTTTVGDGGIVTASADHDTGSMVPAMFEVAAAIQSQSQPYATINLAKFNPAILAGLVYSGNAANGQITTAALTTYGALYLPIGWATTTRPDADLTIQIQTGVGSNTGTGTVVAQAVVRASDDSLGPTLASQLVYFASPFAAAATTQHFVYIKSSAGSSRAWRVGAVDVDILSLAGTTAANLEGASQGTSTDGYVSQGGTQNPAWDLCAALAALPAAPSGFTSTPVGAT